MKKIIFAAVMAVMTSTSFAESTAVRTIKSVNIDGEESRFYFVANEGPWLAPGCENATYVYILSSTLGKKEILAAALAAKMAGAGVKFLGECFTHPDYFVGTYIIVE